MPHHHSASEAYTSNSQTRTLATSPSAGSDLVLYVFILSDIVRSHDTVEWDGTPCSQIGTAVDSNNGRMTTWRLIGPAADGSSKDLVATFTGGASNQKETVIGLYFASNIAQDTPDDGRESATGSSTTPSLSVTSESNDLTISASGYRGAADSITTTTDGSQTERWNLEAVVTSTNSVESAGSEEAGAASVSHDYVVSSSKDWLVVGFNLNEIGGAPAAPISPYYSMYYKRMVAA